MNILSNEQMHEKEQELLELYSQSEIKLRIDLEELVEVKSKKRNLFCLRKLEENTRVWIQKLVPLSRRIQSINLQQQQNGLFKALTFIFLFIIYKPHDHSHQYLKQHIKCSLYSSDIDLLEIKNHSFNKRMKSDVIKSVMATFMKELDAIVHSDSVTRHRLRVEELLGYLLQKNDIIVEGFHLFYRSILCKLQLQNASNCIQQVSVQQAIQNLLSYLQIDCRQFANLYLFNQANMFLSILQEQLIFGRYYQNHASYQQTSEQQLQEGLKEGRQGEVENEEKNRFGVVASSQLNKDLKMFDFVLDSDRNQLCQEEYFQLRSNEATTPCFVGNEEMRFGRKKSLESNGEMHASFNKFKDRLVSEKIHQIQSEEEDFDHEKRQSAKFRQVQDEQKNKFLNLEQAEDSDHFQEEDDNMAPTPMLGGNQMFHFGLKPPSNPKPQPKSPAPSISPKNSQNHQPLTQTKQLISTAIRRQSYQGDNSSQSKSSDNRKKQMKTSKNQIKVIDQTASRVSLVKITEETPKKGNFPGEEDFAGERKLTMNECEKVSSYSNCTCHVEKRAKIKLNSNTVEINIQQTAQVQKYPLAPQRKISQDSMDFVGIKKQPLSYENKAFFFKSNVNKSTDDLRKGDDKRNKSPVKQPKDQHKRQQFINFLKKDKTELIKKLSQKRHAKNNVTSGQLPSSKTDQTKTTQATRKFVKQSMFVGSYNFQNPQKMGQGKNDGSRPVTHGRSMEKQIGVRQRSKTPTQPKLANPFQAIKAPTPYPQQSRKQSTQISTAVNFKSNCVTMQQNQQPPIPKPQITFKVPLQPSQPPAQQNIQWISPQNNIKPYEFYLKREK